MPHGLQTWDAAGVLSFDTDTITGRYLGSVFTGTANGSVVVPGFTTGTPWFFCAKGTTAGDTTVVCVPFVSVSGTTLSWSFTDFKSLNTSANAPRVGCQVFYGVR